MIVNNNNNNDSNDNNKNNIDQHFAHVIRDYP